MEVCLFGVISVYVYIVILELSPLVSPETPCFKWVCIDIFKFKTPEFLENIIGNKLYLDCDKIFMEFATFSFSSFCLPHCPTSPMLYSFNYFMMKF